MRQKEKSRGFATKRKERLIDRGQLTSHTYDEDLAKAIYARLPGYAVAIRQLHSTLLSVRTESAPEPIDPATLPTKREWGIGAKPSHRHSDTAAQSPSCQASTLG